VVLKRGRNREVKRLWESQGVTVSRLIRIRYGSLCLSDTLPLGKFRYATQAEMKTLRDLLS
jgi:23S rRNA pseudouridine2605 synthase